ncbi:hypothetical protein AAFF_G00021990 [Aldrovandia affinis]|uniref:Uncharacterized protein n=1 Tax=Aldrovandia affinis TaxID=143900 RepID=A0AAD7S7B0_9TELE|nr:hypothetical protein AAFF_G00021990 [Aldrovandia affinis]
MRRAAFKASLGHPPHQLLALTLGNGPHQQLMQRGSYLRKSRNELAVIAKLGNALTCLTVLGPGQPWTAPVFSRSVATPVRLTTCPKYQKYLPQQATLLGL